LLLVIFTAGAPYWAEGRQGERGPEKNLTEKTTKRAGFAHCKGQGKKEGKPPLQKECKVGQGPQSRGRSLVRGGQTRQPENKGEGKRD